MALAERTSPRGEASDETDSSPDYSGGKEPATSPTIEDSHRFRLVRSRLKAAVCVMTRSLALRLGRSAPSARGAFDLQDPIWPN
jgi:hypothetical protein